MRLLFALLAGLALATPAAAETVLIQNGRVVTNVGAGAIEAMPRTAKSSDVSATKG